MAGDLGNPDGYRERGGETDGKQGPFERASGGTGTGGGLGGCLAQGAEINVGQRAGHHAKPAGQDVGPELDCSQAIKEVAQVEGHDGAEPEEEDELGTPFADGAVDLLELRFVGGQRTDLIAGEKATDEKGQRRAQRRACRNGNEAPSEAENEARPNRQDGTRKHEQCESGVGEDENDKANRA